MEWIKRLFKRKSEYMYFKKVTDSFYGMCGTRRQYYKEKRATGKFSYVKDSYAVKFQKILGRVEIEKEEYDKWH
jgi:hypothetical protein